MLRTVVPYAEHRAAFVRLSWLPSQLAQSSYTTCKQRQDKETDGNVRPSRPSWMKLTLRASQSRARTSMLTVSPDSHLNGRAPQANNNARRLILQMKSQYGRDPRRLRTSYPPENHTGAIPVLASSRPSRIFTQAAPQQLSTLSESKKANPQILKEKPDPRAQVPFVPGWCLKSWALPHRSKGMLQCAWCPAGTRLPELLVLAGGLLAVTVGVPMLGLNAFGPQGLPALQAERSLAVDPTTTRTRARNLGSQTTRPERNFQSKLCCACLPTHALCPPPAARGSLKPK